MRVGNSVLNGRLDWPSRGVQSAKMKIFPMESPRENILHRPPSELSTVC